MRLVSFASAYWALNFVFLAVALYVSYNCHELLLDPSLPSARAERDNELLTNGLADLPSNRAFLDKTAAKVKTCSQKDICNQHVHRGSGPVWPLKDHDNQNALGGGGTYLARNPDFIYFSLKIKKLSRARAGATVAESEPFALGGVLWVLSLVKPHKRGADSRRYCPTSATHSDPASQPLDPSDDPALCLVLTAGMAGQSWDWSEYVMISAEVWATEQGSKKWKTFPVWRNVSATFNKEEDGQAFELTADQLGSPWRRWQQQDAAVRTGDELPPPYEMGIAMRIWAATPYWHEDTQHVEAQHALALSYQLLLYRVLEVLQLQGELCGGCDGSRRGAEEEEGNAAIVPRVYRYAPKAGAADGSPKENVDGLPAGALLRSSFSWRRGAFNTTSAAELVTLVVISRAMECLDYSLEGAVKLLSAIQRKVLENLEQYSLSKMGFADVDSMISTRAQSPNYQGAMPVRTFSPAACSYSADAAAAIAASKTNSLPAGLTHTRLRKLSHPDQPGGRLWRLLEAYVWFSGTFAVPQPSLSCTPTAARLVLEKGKAYMLATLLWQYSSKFGLSDIFAGLLGGENSGGGIKKGFDVARVPHPLSAEFSAFANGGKKHKKDGGDSSCRLVPWTGDDHARLEHNKKAPEHKKRLADIRQWMVYLGGWAASQLLQPWVPWISWRGFRHGAAFAVALLIGLWHALSGDQQPLRDLLCQLRGRGSGATAAQPVSAGGRGARGATIQTGRVQQQQPQGQTQQQQRQEQLQQRKRGAQQNSRKRRQHFEQQEQTQEEEQTAQAQSLDPAPEEQEAAQPQTHVPTDGDLQAAQVQTQTQGDQQSTRTQTVTEAQGQEGQPQGAAEPSAECTSTSGLPTAANQGGGSVSAVAAAAATAAIAAAAAASAGQRAAGRTRAKRAVEESAGVAGSDSQGLAAAAGPAATVTATVSRAASEAAGVPPTNRVPANPPVGAPAVAAAAGGISRATAAAVASHQARMSTPATVPNTAGAPSNCGRIKLADRLAASAPGPGSRTAAAGAGVLQAHLAASAARRWRPLSLHLLLPPHRPPSPLPLCPSPRITKSVWCAWMLRAATASCTTVWCTGACVTRARPCW